MSMSVEQKMDIIRKAVEMGASVTLNFYKIYGKEEAEKVATEFSSLLETSYSCINGEKSNWINVSKFREGISITAFYEASVEEKKAALLRKIAELENQEVLA